MLPIPNSLKDVTPTFLLSIVATVVTLLLTQGLIDNHISKIVTGIAAVVIPGGFIIVKAVLVEVKHASAITAVAAIVSVVGLLVSQGYVDSGTGKLVEGLASSLLPLLFMIAYSIAAALSPSVVTRNSTVSGTGYATTRSSIGNV